MIPNEWLVRKKIGIDGIRNAISVADKNEIDLKVSERSTTGQNSKQWNYTQFDVLSNFICKELMSEE